MPSLSDLPRDLPPAVCAASDPGAPTIIANNKTRAAVVRMGKLPVNESKAIVRLTAAFVVQSGIVAVL
jgi:hypothetical protein